MEYSTVSKDSWHYKFLTKFTQRHCDLDYFTYPKSECSYFWTIVFFMLCYPFYSLSYHLKPDFWQKDLFTIKELMGGVLIPTFFSLGTLTSIPVYLQLLGISIFPMPPTTSWLIIPLTGIAILGTLGVLMHGVILFVCICFLFGCMAEWVVDKYKEYKYSKISESSKPPKDSLFSHLSEWSSSKKNKLCKPIKYE